MDSREVPTGEIQIHTGSNRSPCQSQRRNGALRKANLGIRKCQECQVRSNYPKEFENKGEGMSGLDGPRHSNKCCTTRKEIQVHFSATYCFLRTKGEWCKGRRECWSSEKQKSSPTSGENINNNQAFLKFLIISECFHVETRLKEKDSRA